MLYILQNQQYRNLFLAQVIALVGTGIITIALALQAYHFSTGHATEILGIILAIKMLAYIFIGPFFSAYIEKFSKKTALIILDSIRASCVIALPFVSELWQVYLLVFTLQSASAVFTPTFQAIIPSILPQEKDYIRALSLSRFAYDLENIVSPILTGLLLAIMSYHQLFLVAVIGFLGSIFFVWHTAIPTIKYRQQSPFKRMQQGAKIYFKTPQLRGLILLNLAIAAASAIVIVTTVSIVKSHFSMNTQAITWAYTAFGLGSMLAAFSLPSILEKYKDRNVMCIGATLLTLSLFIGAFIQSYRELLCLWFILGVSLSITETPIGNIIKRSSTDQTRPTLFSAQFAFSHACWLICYPLVGYSSHLGMSFCFLMMSVIALGSLITTLIFWKSEEIAIEHKHDDLAPDHPHLVMHCQHGVHKHEIQIDEYHQEWFKNG